ncbi:glycosyltransferase [Alicyclobacillus ferrooxydans]|uniref:Glycosyl transferase family 1 n=1 Tax=Alicyclobacillus ferrooxydans TaxID=471514 RepID=A0A0P9GH59_9BACL|nr:glycosyltransferase [Alicyclobacillus ferrooxydans]KPV39354.1 hypothetical protein AN477_22985 [Alicyclobacillus ferrooxydans]
MATTKMSVAQVDVMYYSHSGDISGAEISLLLTMQGLTRTRAILVAPNGELTDRAEKMGIRTIIQNSYRARMTRNPIKLLIGLLGTCAAGLRLRKLVGELHPQIVHANSIRAGLIAILATIGRETKLVWHVRDQLPLNVVGRWVRRVAAYTTDCLFFISNDIQKNFLSDMNRRVRSQVVYNGIELDAAPRRPSIRGDLGVSSDTFVVGVVGQIAPWKRQRDAITAFAQLRKSHPKCELWIVGSPKFRPENVVYEADLLDYAASLGVENEVRFFGFQEDVLSFMDEMDVLLVTSKNEPFGRVVIEAMLMSKPVIGTRGGGIPEIIADGVTGFLVQTGDTEMMANLLDWLQRNVSLRTNLGRAGYERVVSHFSIQRTCAELELAYADLQDPGSRAITHAAATLQEEAERYRAIR